MAGAAPDALSPYIARGYDDWILEVYACRRTTLCYYTHMDNTYDCTSDLPDNFDPSWNEPTEQEWEDIRDEAYIDRKSVV